MLGESAVEGAALRQKLLLSGVPVASSRSRPTFCPQSQRELRAQGFTLVSREETRGVARSATQLISASGRPAGDSSPGENWENNARGLRPLLQHSHEKRTRTSPKLQGDAQLNFPPVKGKEATRLHFSAMLAIVGEFRKGATANLPLEGIFQ
ncbi:Hypothetical predicted protein [Podarcis lilfordi]|uniref:Uncharacterized protein n=1 Tax=Podarcis lilfordi TaxID=74358 RepID=A0AA35L339_9SAUR|nr:Hypothetical predicted protein [Podarcis lilfordi]